MSVKLLVNVIIDFNR